MDVVELAEVQTWLEQTKLELDVLDEDLVDTAATQVFAVLAGVYDTASWTTPELTPQLVRKIIAMLVAAWTWMRQYAEAASEANSYGRWLEEKALTLLTQIAEGSLTLVDVPGVDSVGQPGFWPNDETGSTQAYDARGIAIGDQYSEDIKFAVGQVF